MKLVDEETNIRSSNEKKSIAKKRSNQPFVYIKFKHEIVERQRKYFESVEKVLRYLIK